MACWVTSASDHRSKAKDIDRRSWSPNKGLMCSSKLSACPGGGTKTGFSACSSVGRTAETRDGAG